MRRVTTFTASLLLLAAAGTAAARIDLNCSSTTATSAIGGVVKDAKGTPLSDMKVELYKTNRALPTGESAITDSQGRYRICAGGVTGADHDTYDVHVVDQRSGGPLYAMASQPYTTYTNLGDADFTPESGHPLTYMAHITITPDAISTATASADVEWVARSKAAADTTMLLTIGHLGYTEWSMRPAPPEDGGPEAGGWNVWTFSAQLDAHSTERLYWASIRGLDGSTQITQSDRRPYTVDNQPPIFGVATADSCGPGVYANAFSPASPPGTTNRSPIVTHGVCDRYSGGARSGLDPFSLRGRMCSNSLLTENCEDIRPVLSTQTIVWFPSEPLALGDYYFEWTISDKAGNVARTPRAYHLLICAGSAPRCGQRPSFTAVAPGNLGSGNTAGIVAGSSLTTPSSIPVIGFRVLDADGQNDLAPGTLRVRVYYGDDTTLVYDYDPAKARNEYDALTARGGANFDLSSGMFRADGYPLQGKPPGRYFATASITDAGGNSATMTWSWILAAAA